MELIEQIELVSKAITEYGDEDMSINDCVQIYLQENNIQNIDVDDLVNNYEIEEAVSHGIPRKVAEGQAKLTDYFTQEYINVMSGQTLKH